MLAWAFRSVASHLRPAFRALPALILWGGLAHQAAAIDTLPALLDRVRPALVTVTSYGRDGRLLLSAPGFVTGPEGRVLTSRGVLENAARVTCRTASGPVRRLTSVLAEDVAAGVVLLESAAATGAGEFLEITAGKPAANERVFAIGGLNAKDGMAVEAHILGVRETPGMGQVLDVSTPSGSLAAGALIVDTDGEVAGLAASWTAGERKLHLAISGARLRALKPGQPRAVTAWNASRGKQAAAAEAAFRNGIGLLMAGDYDGALPCFEEAVAKEPGFAEAWFHAGYVRGKQGQAAGKMEAYRRAVELKPDYAEARYSLGVSYALLRQREPAEAELKALEKLSPELAEKLEALIDALLGHEHEQPKPQPQAHAAI